MALDRLRVARARKGVPLVRGDDRRRQRGQAVRDRLRVARGAEDPVHAARRHRREEILEVQADDRRLAGVDRRVGARAAAADEAVRGVVRRDAVEDLVQDPALDLLELELGAGDRARRRALARLPHVRVVAEPSRCGDAVQRARVGEPRELTGVQLEQVGERAGRDDLRHRPADPPHPRLVQEPARDVRPRAVDVRLAERQRDVLRELARAIHRRARIRDHRRAHDRGQPARTRPQRLPSPAHHRRLGPRAREERRGERRSELASDRGLHPARMLSPPERSCAAGGRVRRADCSGRACAVRRLAVPSPLSARGALHW